MESIRQQQPSILIVKLRFHGDMLLTTPVINTLIANYPSAQLDLLLYEDTKPILSCHPHIRKLYGIQKKPGSILQQIRMFIQLAKQLRRNRYDLIINLADQWPIAFLIKLIGSERLTFSRAGFKNQVWKRCFTQLTEVVGEHTVEQNLSILAPLHLPEIVTDTSMYYQEDHWYSVKSKASYFDFAKPYVVIQPTARQIFKCWDDNKFAAVNDYLKEQGYQVFLTSGPAPEDLQMIKDIHGLCQHKPIISLAGETSFLELAALIDHAALFVGVDSAPMHMAAALNTPIVCLFGATNQKQWHPWSKKYRLLWAGDYAPMPERSERNRQFRYLSCIPKQDVIAAIQTFLPHRENP